MVVNSQGERRSRRKSRGKIRAYLQTSSDDEDGRSGLNGAAHDMRKRLSRTGSAIMQIQSAKTSTARLSKSESQGSDAEESVMVADRIKERAYYDSLAAQNHVSSPVDEDKHPDSVMAPLRRKSLYTPGLATRNTNDILRKPPPQDTTEPQIDLDYYYDPSKPAYSPLSQIAALSAGEDGRCTPSNLQYSQLGGLQLGTLRVTNGAASPVLGNRAPDSACRSHTPESRSHDEYYTASEGSVAGELSTPLPPRGSSPLRFESKYEPSVQQGLKDSQTPRGSFPFRQETPSGAAIIAHEYMAELDGSPFRKSATPLPVDEGDSLNDEGIVIPQADGPAADMWRQFIDDAESRHGATVTREDAFRRLNGNTPSIPDSQRLSVPSSMASKYSVSTEAPKTDSGYSSNSSLSANHATLATKDEPKPQSRSARDDLPNQSRCLSGPREMPQRASMPGEYLSHAPGPAPRDYSFSVIPRHPSPSPAPSLAAISSSQTVSPIQPSTRSTSSSAIRKLYKPRPKSQPPPIDSITRNHSLSQVDIPRVPSLIATQHAERLRQFPLLEHTFPSSHHTTYNESISPTESNPVPIRFPSPENAWEAATSSPFNMISRLQEKRRSRSRAPSQNRANATVDEDHMTPSNIVRSPSWSHYGRKSKEQKRRAKEDRETEKHFTSVEKEFEKRLQNDRREFEKQARLEEDRQRTSRSRSASRTRTKSSERRSSQHSTPTIIADFGTVIESLGGNPYDIATSMFPSASQHRSSWHPHQISTAMPRPSSTVGTNEAEAAKSTRRARSQSFGRPNIPTDDEPVGRQSFTGSRPRPQTMVVEAPPMPALAAVDLMAHDLEWARNRRRTHSFSGAKLSSELFFNDRGGLPARSIRPESLFIDAPPVPVLPSTKHFDQCETQTTRSRPQSMGLDSSPVSSLPASQRADQEESQVSISSSPSKGAMARPRKTKPSKLVPDLWCHGSLEKKGPKAFEQSTAISSSNDTSFNDEGPSIQIDNVWEAQRRAWSQRRKSAGEALLRNQIDESFDGYNPSDPTIIRNDDRPSSTASALIPESPDSSEPEQTSRPRPTPMVSLPNPLGSHPQVLSQESFHLRPMAATSHRPASYHLAAPQQTARPGPSPLAQPSISQKEPQLPTPAQRRGQTQSFYIPRKRIGSGTSTPTSAFEHLTGRYTGGLQYGYEPGCGLGGSAGTRGAKTEASRKSVEVSKGFGLDLSDVPIFVAPTPAV